MGNPQFKALAERLEELKERHEQGLLISVEFLKELLDSPTRLLRGREGDRRRQRTRTAARRR